ncbi:hypothetical protein SBA3_1420010 [Candidatus Sulfopaludibacter sp. SbA3]|nr:hypothetical protein SBA3_1420010 [Candidatus Sulfopaludibacter sp. SbA3]
MENPGRLSCLRVNQTIEIKPGELRCPRCFGKDVVHSMPRGILDAIMRKLNRVPRHCRACAKRFYVLQGSSRQPLPDGRGGKRIGAATVRNRLA